MCNSVESRNSLGGTSKDMVLHQVSLIRER